MNNKKKSLVITTIASSNSYILRKYAKISQKENVDLIIIGDKKSPSKFSLKGANFFIKKAEIFKFEFIKDFTNKSLF